MNLRTLLKAFCLLAVSVGFTPQSHAAIETHLSYFTWWNKTEGPQLGNSEGGLNDISLKLGYATDKYFLGGTFNQFTNEFANAKPRTSFGFTAGFRPSSWILDLTLYLFSNYELSSVTTLGKGIGYALDIGHRWSVSSNFFAGMQFTFRALDYDEAKISGVTATNKNKISMEYLPSLLFGYKF
ncbi:MAG: hypothetical protein N2578_07950 [Bdellovibrionaceae bacterium]|nr:hypothetical protein [Pseudobdellovibrionaceae bacterium]